MIVLGRDEKSKLKFFSRVTEKKFDIWNRSQHTSHHLSQVGNGMARVNLVNTKTY